MIVVSATAYKHKHMASVIRVKRGGGTNSGSWWRSRSERFFSQTQTLTSINASKNTLSHENICLATAIRLKEGGTEQLFAYRRQSEILDFPCFRFFHVLTQMLFTDLCICYNLSIDANKKASAPFIYEHLFLYHFSVFSFRKLCC